ncbi:MAG TPA: PEP-CTERM sorting domain-containing protein [Gemmataceae bacterium]|nr:PEP-CTERM sorting domain-containing protein [Gemmataceae bacterium]
MSRFALRLWTAVVYISAALVAASPVRAEVILGPSQFGASGTPYFRFGSFPDDPTQTQNNPSFYLSNLDFSGVGWRLPGIFSTAAYSVTMIDDIHFLGAWHVHVGNFMNVGDTINFRPAGSTNTLLQRTVANVQNVPNPDGSTSDVLLGTLNVAFAPGSGIAAYPITPAAVTQQEMYIYGRQSEVGRNNVSGTQAGINFPIDGNPAHNETLNAVLYDYDQPGATGLTSPDGLPSTVGNDEAYLNGGDSGGPSFVLTGGQLQIIGTHAAVTDYAGVGLTKPAGAQDDVSFSLDSNLPAYSATIAAMVPEPSTTALSLFAAGGALASYVRSRRRAKSA